MRATGGDGAASTVHGCRPARSGALASTLALAAIVLAGCASHDATGSAGSNEIEGEGGPSGSGDDGAAPPLQGSIDGGTADHGGTTDQTTATADSGQGGHAICSQSWSVVVDDPDAPPGVLPAGARTLALDGAGNMYVAASFVGSVNVAGQTFQSPGSGSESLLVVKLDSTCKVLWAKAFGAAQSAVQVASIAADAAGNVVVAGQLDGAPLDFGSGSVGSPVSMRPEALVLKLGPDGKSLWSRAYLPSAGSFLIDGYGAEAIDVALDSHGNTVFLAAKGCPPRGACDPGTIDFGGGPVSYTWSLVGLDANGGFVFDANASFAGQSEWFAPSSLTMDAAGHIWAAGFGDQLDIVAFDATGHQQWAQGVSPATQAPLWQPMVRVDANDEAFTAVASEEPSADGGLLDDRRLYKLSASGSASWTPPAAIPAAAWDSQFRSTQNQWWAAWPGGRLAVDPSGKAVVASAFAGSANFGSAGSLTSAGGLDATVLRFDAQGHASGAERWGGADDDLPVDVVVDAAGDAVIAGWSVPPFGLDGGLDAPQDITNYAIFVAKIGL
jgi:hypothetical protein